MRKYTVPVSMTVEYFLSDHLGSTSITTDNAGAKISEMRYKPWGEVRYSWTATQTTTPAYTLPKFTFTGQYSYMDDPSTSAVTEGFGLMFYNARMYDPALGRFTSADTIVPSGSQGLDRYAYVNNSPVNYTDPSGHCAMDADPDDCFVPGQNNPAPPTCSSSMCNPNGGSGGNGGGGGGGNPPDEGGECHGVLCSLTEDSHDQLNLEDCNNNQFLCGGNEDMGYVYDPETGLIATWVDGMDNIEYNSFNPDNPTVLNVNLAGFMEEVDNFDDAMTNLIWSGGAAVFSTAAVVGLAIFVPSPAGGAAISGMIIAGGTAIVSIGAFFYNIDQVNTSQQDAIIYWNGIGN